MRPYVASVILIVSAILMGKAMGQDVGIPPGTAYVCSFTYMKMSINGADPRERAIEPMPVALTSEFAIQCPGGSERCNTYFYSAVVQGSSILYVANNGARLITNVPALALGAGIEIASNVTEYASKVSLTGECTETAEEAALEKFLDANRPSE